MGRKFTAVQKRCGWPEAISLIESGCGKEASNESYCEAKNLYDEFSVRYKTARGINKGHITGAVSIGAIYIPLKRYFGQDQAIEILSKAMQPASIAKHNKIEKLSAPVFMRVAHIVSGIMYSEKAGFKRVWHCNSNKERRYDLLSCPYVDVLTAMGCPEACRAICIQDDYSFQNMKNGVAFLRTKTLGRGDDCCDFGFGVKDRNSSFPRCSD